MRTILVLTKLKKKTMTKMDMVWVATAKRIYPDTQSAITVTKADIEEEVADLFGTNITSVMITRHLANSIDRQANPKNYREGGSRNRYLVKDEKNRFRLYKQSDGPSDGFEKDGPCCPQKNRVGAEFNYLIMWYWSKYHNSG